MSTTPNLPLLPKVIQTAPERIWLDIGFDPEEEGSIAFDRLEDVTWSGDDALGHGIEYVRADVAAIQRQKAEPAAPSEAPMQGLAEWLRARAEQDEMGLSIFPRLREWASEVESARTRLSAAPEVAQRPVEGWQPIETAPKGRKVLAGYFNKLGNWRTVMACYYLPQTLEAPDDIFDETSDGYAPEGWYEESESQESILPTDEPPTHWMPLPAAPSQRQQAQPSTGETK